MYLRCIAALLLLSAGCGAVAQQSGQSAKSSTQRPVIELEGPNSTSAALFVQAVLEQAYDQIGYDVSYRTVPLARSFIEANKGELDGLRARVAAVADRYPNLIKVPFEILDFSLVLLADRRVCGICDVSQIQQLAVTRGVVALEEKLSTTLAGKDIVEVTTAQQTLEMLLAGKVQAAIMPDTNVPQSFFDTNHHLIKRTLAVLPDYHYLHKKHGHLVPALAAKLDGMAKRGVIAQLREKYQLRPARQDIENVQLDKVNVISERWKHYTDDENGTYWQILSKVYESKVQQLNFSTENWREAQSALRSGNIDILVGAYGHELPAGYIKSNLHIDYDFPVSAFGKSKDAIQALLQGDQSFLACFEPGYSFEVWLPESAIISHADIKTCRAQLQAGEIDMVLDYQAYWPDDMKQDHQGVEIVEGRPLFLFFKDSAKGLKLKTLFDHNYSNLIKRGEIESLFPKPEYYRNANLKPERN